VFCRGYKEPKFLKSAYKRMTCKILLISYLSIHQKGVSMSINNAKSREEQHSVSDTFLISNIFLCTISTVFEEQHMIFFFLDKSDTSLLDIDKHAFVSIYAIFRTRFLVFSI
jgi:hypothetical protein